MASLGKTLAAAALAAAFTVPQCAFAAAPSQQAMQAEINALKARLDRLEHRMAAAPEKHHKAAPRRKIARVRPPVRTQEATVRELAQKWGAPQRYAETQPTTASDGSSVPQTQLGQPGPAQQSVQSVYEQQNALFTKGLTITPGATYTYGDNRFFTLNGFMALGAIFLGNIDVSRQQNSVFTPTMNLTYGINKRLQLDMTVPFVVRQSTYSSAGAQSSSQQVSEKEVKNAGLGDVNFGFFYQLRQRRLDAPIVVVNAHVTAPTGTTPYGIKVVQDSSNNNLSYVKSLPTGVGVWNASAGASVIKTVDPAILFAGVNYYYNFPGHYKDISPYEGTTTPGTVQPGNALSFSLGTAFSLNDRMSATFSFQDTMVGSERLRADGAPWQSVGGSSMNAGVFNIGTTYAINRHVSWQMMLGIGVTHDAPNFQLSMRFPHSF